MNLEIKRVWHDDNNKLYYFKKEQYIGVDHYIDCINDKNEVHSFRRNLLTLDYGTEITDNYGIEIISNDILEVKFFNNFEPMKIVVINKNIGKDWILDLYPRLHNPSLGVGYLLSKNIKSIKILGNAHEHPERF